MKLVVLNASIIWWNQKIVWWLVPWKKRWNEKLQQLAELEAGYEKASQESRLELNQQQGVRTRKLSLMAK